MPDPRYTTAGPRADNAECADGPEQAVAAREARGGRHDLLFNGSRICWRLWGSGEPLVLIHGGHGSWLHWLEVIDPLAELATVACLDLPGFGESDPLPGAADPADLAEAAAAGVAVLFGGATSVHLAGFSFGGVVAAHLAARLGGRVKSLSLIGSGGLGGRPDLTMKSRKRGMSAAEIAAVHRHNLATLMIADPRRVDELAVLIQRRNTRRAPAVVSRRFSLTPMLVDVLKSVVCPVFAIWGEKDATLGPFLSTKVAGLREASPDAVVEWIPDCGHWAMYEQPDRVVELLAARLARAGGRAP